MKKQRMCIALSATVLLWVAGIHHAAAQAVISLEPGTSQAGASISTPPSVGNGIANGAVKPAGAPSVGDGRANGVVKREGAPSVGDGVANGVVKSTTINQ